MKTTPWRDLKHKAPADELETVRREALAEAERLRMSQELQKGAEASLTDAGSEAA